MDDLEACVALGVDAIGLNFISKSPRNVTIEKAKTLVSAARKRVMTVGIVADLTLEQMRELRDEVQLDCLQLHGSESPETVFALLPHAYKAVRIKTAEDVITVDQFPGEYILLDAFSDSALGGTGLAFDWSYLGDLPKRRQVTLAGGLRPGNVAQAISSVHPFCVDVASGVEDAPGVKNFSKLNAFVAAVRQAPRRPY